MAVENGVQNAELGYLLFPFEQYSNLAGKPLVGGHMEIYEAGTDTKYISYQNWDGAENPFRIPIPNDGRITVLADPTKTFDCYLYDSYNNLVCSRLNVQANVPGNISIKGADTILKNTDGTLDIYLRTLGNNVREYTVNTHNKVLDVQEPLYFVENSNTATVIGFSGDNYVQKDYLTDFVSSSISGKMDVSKLEYNENGEISAYDGSAFAGQGAGDPEVNDLVHSNSATWNDVSAKLDTTAFSTVSGDFLTAIPDNYATKDYVQSSVSSKLDCTAFSTVSGNFLTAHQSLDGLMSASLLGMSGSTITSYNNMPFPIGGGEGDAEVNQIVHANSADWNNVSAKLDTTAFSTVSGNFLTAHQSLDGYLTKASADTLYQPTGDYATHDDLTAYQTVEGMTAYQPSGNYADATALDGKVDTSSFTAFSSTTNEKIEYISGALSGTYELSAGNGIDITDYPNEQKTVISVTAQGGDPEVEQVVKSQSATWDSVTGKADTTALNDYATTSQLADKLDTTAFSTVSGNFLTAHQDLSNYATTASVAEKLDTTAFSTVSGEFLTAHQDLSDYATTAELANKLDTTAFSDVSGTFLTAHQDISNKLDITAFSDVSGSFLTAVPDTYLQNTDLTVVDNKITEISGVPLSAGDELPSGVMNTSALEYNAVNEISGYNGSAIAQYGAEKQWLQHDDTLVHAANSAQYALGVNLSAVAQLLGVDETLLWSGNFNSSGNIILSGSINDYKKVEVYFSNDNGDVSHHVQTIWPGSTRYNILVPAGDGNCWYQNRIVSANAEGTILAVIRSKNFNVGNYTTTATALTSNNTFGDAATFRKIVGIGRKQ